MYVPLRVLLVEDNPDDAELVLRALSRAEFDVRSRRVEDATSLIDALGTAEWDIILADYNLPGFSGLEAIRIVSEQDADIPLILVSGAIDVPTALAAVKAGARDFVAKDDMQRLPSVVEREVEEAAQRRRRRLAETERDLALAELREANQQLAAFASLADIDIRGASTEHIVGEVLTRVAEAERADGATILILDGGLLVTGGTVGTALGAEETVALGAGFAGIVAAEDKPHYVGDLRCDRPELEAALPGGEVRSTVAVPMHHAGRVSGVLRIDWCTPFEFLPWQLPLLQIAADRCATMIENSRLIEREHAIAETLQQVLLSASPNIPGLEVGQFYASATEETLVGGDFYDVFEIGDGRIAFSIGDVSGKGLDAARVTALLKNTIRALAVEGTATDEVLNRGNEVVCRFTDPEVFITAVYGLLDPATGELTYSSAGHPPPVVLGAEGARMLAAHGPLLGAFPGARFPIAETRLAHGESVVLYTDGLTEAKNPSGVFFGEDRLKASLELLGSAGTMPQQVATDLFEQVWEFSAGKLRDDIAIVVLRPRIGASATE